MHVGGVECVAARLRILHEEPARRINVERVRVVPRTCRCDYDNPRPESEAVHSIPRSQVPKVPSSRIHERENARDVSREHLAELAASLKATERGAVSRIKTRERRRFLKPLAFSFDRPREIDSDPREKTPCVHAHEDPRDLLPRRREDVIWPFKTGQRRPRRDLGTGVEDGKRARERIPAAKLRGRQWPGNRQRERFARPVLPPPTLTAVSRTLIESHERKRRFERVVRRFGKNVEG